MSALTVFSERDPATPLEHTRNPARVAEILRAIGVRFEQWQASQPVAAGASPEAVMEAYRADIDRLVAEQGFQSVDVISMAPDHPQKQALRDKFLSEHTHGEDEVRFFVDGRGLFTLHVDERVYEVLCERGDLISVPAGASHWFDMGPQPEFIAIRFFNNPDGWIAHYTGDDIALKFSRLEA